MGNHPYTRVVIDGEHPKQVLSIREQGNGRLTILTELSGLGAIHLGEAREIIRHKTSIHPTAQSIANEKNFHTTTTFADKIEDHSFIQTEAIRDGRFQPVYALRAIHPTLLRTATLDPQDDVIRLPAFNPEVESLFCTLWISAPDLPDQFTPHPSMSWVVRKYRLFAVTLAYSYASIPSTNWGWFQGLSTVREENMTPEQRALNHRSGPSEGVALEHVGTVGISLLNKVIEAEPGPWVTRLQSAIRRVRGAPFLPNS